MQYLQHADLHGQQYEPTAYCNTTITNPCRFSLQRSDLYAELSTKCLVSVALDTRKPVCYEDIFAACTCSHAWLP